MQLRCLHLLRILILILFMLVGTVLTESGLTPSQNNIALAQNNCPPVQNTPAFTLVYGAVTINNQAAPVGTIVEFKNPRGDTVGCIETDSSGVYGSWFVYGEDTSVTPPIPGMRTGEAVEFYVDGQLATATPPLLWINDKDFHQVDLSVFSPPVAPALSIGLLGLDIVLNWTDDPANVSYDVHRSVTPLFTPNENSLLTTLPAGSTGYTDYDAAGNVNVNYFYQIRAIGNNGNQTADSNEVGEIDYPLNNSGGQYTLIAVPFLNPTISDAGTLATYIGQVGVLLKWNPVTQAFRFFAPPAAGDNFTVVPGEVVFVTINAGGPTVVTMMGESVAVQHNLIPDGFNFVSLPMSKANLTLASEVAADITSINSMLQWNETIQAFRFFAPPAAGDNFSVGIGTPFIVYEAAGGPTVWP